MRLSRRIGPAMRKRANANLAVGAVAPEALYEVEEKLQHRTEAGRAGDRDALQQLLRNLGDLTVAECEERVTEGYSAASMLEKLVAERRIAAVRIAGEERYIAAEDAGM